jgi:spoIIIJ-associated protein
MLNQDLINRAREITEEFFSKTTLDLSIEVSSDEDDALSVRIKSSEPQLLIGDNGQNLIEIQHLLRMVLKKKIEGLSRINLDVNDYQKQKTDRLREMARNIANEVSLTRQEKVLAPMASYERRIVHLELMNRSDVSSESVGDGPERKVVIKPKI